MARQTLLSPNAAREEKLTRRLFSPACVISMDIYIRGYQTVINSGDEKCARKSCSGEFAKALVALETLCLFSLLRSKVIAVIWQMFRGRARARRFRKCTKIAEPDETGEIKTAVTSMKSFCRQRKSRDETITFLRRLFTPALLPGKLENAKSSRACFRDIARGVLGRAKGFSLERVMESRGRRLS